MQRYLFRSTSTTIIRIWSSWLVQTTSENFDFVPKGVDKLHLDAPDGSFMDMIPSFDVLVLSSGHWFAKQSVYILNNEIVGGQLWWPDNSRKKKIDSSEAYEISVATIMSSLVTNPDYKGLTVVRSYSPDHYEGGAWNTGGSCTGKVIITTQRSAVGDNRVVCACVGFGLKTEPKSESFGFWVFENRDIFGLQDGFDFCFFGFAIWA